MKSNPIAGVLLALLFAVPALCSPTGMNPDAPPETAQFAFFIGEWDCATYTLQPDGNYREGKAHWVAEWDYDGYAILDRYTTLDDDGNVIRRGMGYRSYSPDSSAWNAVTQSVNGFTGRHFLWHKMPDGDLVAYWERTDAQGREVIDRVRFTNWSENHFEWRLDRSFDGGETWFEDGFYIIATRVKASGG